MSEASPRPEITVVFPLVDARGDSLERVRTWTHQQTLSRDRFQVIAVSDGSDPGTAEQVARLLAPQDRLIQHPTQNFIELYDVGIRQAAGRLLVLTEHHCLAHPDCLAEVAAYFRQHDFDGACLNVQWICLNQLARLKWQERNAERVSFLASPDHWNKFVLAGFAVHRDVLLAAGGIEYAYGLFVELSTGARLHSLGYRLGHAEQAKVDHLDDNRFDEVLGFIRDFTAGEIAFVAANDPEYCARYFGHIPEWGQQHHYRPESVRSTRRQLRRALWANLWPPAACRPAKAFGLASELLRRVLPPGLQLLRARLAVTAARLRYAFWWFNDPRRTRALKDTCDRMVHYVRLRSMLRRIAGAGGSSPTPVVNSSERAWYPGQMSAAQLIGCHPRETYEGQSFRWTEPVATILLDVPADDSEVTIDTRGLRGPQCDSLLACSWNDHQLQRRAVSVQDGRIRLSIHRDMFVPRGPQHLTLICQPLLPRRAGVADDRRLGLPIFSIQISPKSLGDRDAAAAA